MTTINKKIANRVLSRCIKSCIALLLMVAFVLSDVQVVLAQTGFNLSNAVDSLKSNISQHSLGLENSALTAVPNVNGNSTGSTLPKANPNLINTYVLSVATGANAGTQVLYFAVKYKDTSNTTRTHYILISDNELQNSYTEIVNGTSTFSLSKDTGNTMKQRFDNVKAATGYSVSGYPNSIGNSTKPLAANSTNNFIIKTETPIQRVEEISFFVRSDTSNGGKNEWRCEDMRLYKANNIYGLDMYGYYSNNFFLKFDGTEIAAAKATAGYHNFTWSVDKLIRIEANSAGTEAVRLNVGQNIPYSSANPRQVYVQLGFEDLAGAGIESLVTSSVKGEKTISKMSVAESLVLRIIYQDTQGDDRRVDLPYITSSAAWMNASSAEVANADIIGLAQQGEGLGFVATLPDFDFLKEYKFFYDDAMVKELGFNVPSTAKHNARLAARKDTNDTISLAYFTATDAVTAMPKVEVVSGVARVSITGDPQLYYAQKEQKVSLGSTAGNVFKQYQDGIKLEPKDYDNTYIIKITTDDVEAASSTADISMQIGYIDTSGVYSTSGLYKLKDLVSAYYGYWPGNGADAAYTAALSRGSTMYGIITLNDVESFDNISVTSDGYINDDWQFKKVEIDKVIDISKRGAEWTTTKIGNLTLDRKFFRNITSEPIIKSETNVYLKGSGETKELAFGNKSVTEIEDSNWTDNRYLMSYEQAIKNLGFTKSRHMYTIQVKVGNDKGASMANDDCGSKNLFYFQLIFKGGRSAYVLANQQISSDGFRAGVTETFTVATNQNYGEIVSINIIADDMSSNSDIYDKLKIDEITVTKDSSGGLSRQWRISNVGWVTIDYRDEGESSKKTGRAARSEVELARNYAVTNSAYVMNLLFTVSTSINADHVKIGEGEYLNEDGNVIDENGNIKKDQMAQFSGTMMGLLNYVNGAGEPKTMTFDIADAMYQYAYKQPNYLDDFQKGASTSLNSAVSDPSFMFRKNHTDRFILSIADVSEIKSLMFLPTSLGATTWYVNNVSVSLIDTDGTLGLNAANEYERNSVLRTVATNVPNEKPYDVLCTMGYQQELNIPFIPNSIKIEKVEEDTWSAAVTRVPSTTNDTLNVFIHTNKISPNTEIFKLSSAIRFTDSFGNAAQTSAGEMLRKDGDNLGEYVFYAIGLSANNMSTLNKIVVQANSKTLLTDYANHAIIQRVRSGVLIETYRVNFASHNSGAPLEAAPDSGGSATIESETQIITIQLGKDMEETALVKQNRDLAVAISYTTTSDVRNTVYTSPYIYVTDEQYKMLSGGDILSLSFKLPYMKEIKGLKLVTTGGLKLPIENAIVSTYVSNQETQGQRKLTGWYSFPQKYEANASTDTKLPLSKGLEDAEAISQIGIKLVGGKAAGMETDTTTGITQRLDANPLKVTIGYFDENGLMQEAVYDDIRKHKSASKLSDIALNGGGDDSTVKDVPADVLYASVLLRGVKSIRWVKVEPYDQKADNIVSVYINEIVVTQNAPQGDTTLNSVITARNRVIEGQDPALQVGFENIVVTVEGKNFDAAANKDVEFKAINETIKLVAKYGKNITFTPIINGSEQTVKVTTQQKIDQSFVDVFNVLTVKDGIYTFSVPKNITQKDIEYRVNVMSKENPSIGATLIITSPADGKKIVSLEAKVYSTEQAQYVSFKSTQEDLHVTAESGTSVYLYSQLDGQFQGVFFNLKAYKVIDGVQTELTEEMIWLRSHRSFFTVQDNNSAINEEYVVVYTPVSEPETSLKIIVTVPPKSTTPVKTEETFNIRAYPNYSYTDVDHDKLKVVMRNNYYDLNQFSNNHIKPEMTLKSGGTAGSYVYELNNVPVFGGLGGLNPPEIKEEADENQIASVQIDLLRNGVLIETYYYEYTPNSRPSASGFRGLKYVKRENAPVTP